MSLNELLAFVSSDQALSLLRNTWIVPAGLVFLYVYGQFRFNTPMYSLELALESGSTASQSEFARLITLAPPILTTRRSRYKGYALRYVLILQLVFLVFIFLYSTVQSAAELGHVSLPDLTQTSLEKRALFGLFILTGLLPSFPLVNQILTLGC